MEDQSISPKMLEITVGAAKQAVKDRRFIQIIYPLITLKELNYEKTVARKELDFFVR